MSRRLTPLIDGSKSAWRSLAIELLGASYYKDGKLNKAEELLTKVVVAPGAPPDLRKRVDILLQLVAAAKSQREVAAVRPGSGKAAPDDKTAKTN